MREVRSIQVERCKDCVQILKDAVKRAKAGEVEELALVEVKINGEVRTEWTA